MSDFDRYASDYRDAINKVTKLIGEEFEFFIDLRIRLMKEKLGKTFTDGNHTILDFGCGIGATEVHLRQHFPNSVICAADTSKESIVAAQKLGLEGVEFSALDGVSLHYENERFDLIYSNGTFHHIPHVRHAAILMELSRVLKKNGKVFIFENNPYNPLMMRNMRILPFDKDAVPVKPKRLFGLMEKTGYDANPPDYYFFFPNFLKVLRPFERYLRQVPLGAQYYVFATKK
ncbi:MAG: class I SAM-dependent methyltransferase [Dissulfurispiraceae bacterium]